jgi:hypothetical protein
MTRQLVVPPRFGSTTVCSAIRKLWPRFLVNRVTGKVRSSALFLLLAPKRPHDSAEHSGNDQNRIPAHFNLRSEKSASVEGFIRAIVERADGVRLQVGYGKDETAESAG